MISYCTTCKNRLEFLKETLGVSLSNLLPEDEIILLDYDSEDGLKEWISKFTHPQLFVYSLNEGKQQFKMARAKNIAHRMGTNPILCNLDADNKVTPGFSKMLVDLVKPGFFAHTDEEVFGGSRGRIAFWHSDFNRIGGYAEKMVLWGYDVTDIIKRAKRANLFANTFPYTLVSYLEHEDRARCMSNKVHSQIMDEKGIINPNKDWGAAKLLRLDTVPIWNTITQCN